MYQFRNARPRLLACATVLLMACGGELPTAPTTTTTASVAPTNLIAAGDGAWHTLREYFVGTTYVTELELGAALLGEEYQGSVFIKLSVPQVTGTPTSSTMPCITSTVMKTEVRAGWTASIKKPGGCDKSIEVDFTSKTKQRATFKWTYIFGLTKVDFGAVR
jgi:hypothetical protein